MATEGSVAAFWQRSPLNRVVGQAGLARASQSARPDPCLSKPINDQVHRCEWVHGARPTYPQCPWVHTPRTFTYPQRGWEHVMLGWIGLDWAGLGHVGSGWPGLAGSTRLPHCANSVPTPGVG
eukprot:gene24040-biopygen20871